MHKHPKTDLLLFYLQWRLSLSSERFETGLFLKLETRWKYTFYPFSTLCYPYCFDFRCIALQLLHFPIHGVCWSFFILFDAFISCLIIQFLFYFIVSSVSTMLKSITIISSLIQVHVVGCICVTSYKLKHGDVRNSISSHGYE